MAALERDGLGFPAGPEPGKVPIVPAAVIFDLGRGGGLARPGDRLSGLRASPRHRRASRVGGSGRGRGWSSAGLKGGLGIWNGGWTTAPQWAPPWR